MLGKAQNVRNGFSNVLIWQEMWDHVVSLELGQYRDKRVKDKTDNKCLCKLFKIIWILCQRSLSRRMGRYCVFRKMSNVQNELARRKLDTVRPVQNCYRYMGKRCVMASTMEIGRTKVIIMGMSRNRWCLEILGSISTYFVIYIPSHFSHSTMRFLKKITDIMPFHQ